LLPFFPIIFKIQDKGSIILIIPRIVHTFSLCEQYCQESTVLNNFLEYMWGLIISVPLAKLEYHLVDIHHEMEYWKKGNSSNAS